MTLKKYYIYKAFKNGRWHYYSEKYKTPLEALKWKINYRKKVGYTLQKELKLFKIYSHES